MTWKHLGVALCILLFPLSLMGQDNDAFKAGAKIGREGASKAKDPIAAAYLRTCAIHFELELAQQDKDQYLEALKEKKAELDRLDISDFPYGIAKPLTGYIEALGEERGALLKMDAEGNFTKDEDFDAYLTVMMKRNEAFDNYAMQTADYVVKNKRTMDPNDIVLLDKIGTAAEEAQKQSMQE